MARMHRFDVPPAAAHKFTWIIQVGAVVLCARSRGHERPYALIWNGLRCPITVRAERGTGGRVGRFNQLSNAVVRLEKLSAMCRT